MTDLLHVLPDKFPTQSYTHLLPSLEKNQVTVNDILTLDAIDVARRAHVPVTEVQRLAHDILQLLYEDLGFQNQNVEKPVSLQSTTAADSPVKSELPRSWQSVGTLDDTLDAALAGGFPRGYVTEITGESGAGKTQFLLTLLLNAQLAPPRGFGQSALYISTEAGLQTTRLSQILRHHPYISQLPRDQRPSLSRVLSIQTPDLESQEHILQYQLPVVIRQQDIGLVVIDSIAANYRAEFEKNGAKHGGAAMAHRSSQLIQLGQLLRQVALKQDVAIVVANQVADRFSANTKDLNPLHPQSKNGNETGTPVETTVSHSQERFTTPTQTQGPTSHADFEPLTLDHQQRWFTGWGDEPTHRNNPNANKTPSLGLVWTNQIAARIALMKQPMFRVQKGSEGQVERDLTGWNRRMKVVFAPWVSPSGTAADQMIAGVPFEIVEAGVRCTSQQ
ncbi:MAG: hypothetical protein M1820_003510 [Bogoriella megaspora]|nr:MAG: hypothetical protein M1820_003510 [Bogoriella megaspora]